MEHTCFVPEGAHGQNTWYVFSERPFDLPDWLPEEPEGERKEVNELLRPFWERIDPTEWRRRFDDPEPWSISVLTCPIPEGAMPDGLRAKRSGFSPRYAAAIKKDPYGADPSRDVLEDVVRTLCRNAQGIWTPPFMSAFYEPGEGDF